MDFYQEKPWWQDLKEHLPDEDQWGTFLGYAVGLIFGIGISVLLWSMELPIIGRILKPYVK